jgi:uncharacterized membrane protein YdjX (TVP38/TMEM64 family)
MCECYETDEGIRLARVSEVSRSLWSRFATVVGGSKQGSVALLVVAAMFGATIAAMALGLDLQPVLELLREHHSWLLGFVTGAPILASLLFMVIYAAAVAISVPGVAVLTVIGGYLFGWFHGTVLVLIAATVGASAVFLLTRSAFGNRLRVRAGPAVQRFAAGFRRNALSYGFVLNVVPFFPYALIILVPAVCGVPLLTFVAGMFLGLVPGTFLFAGLGDGLDHVLASGAPLRPTSFLTPEIVLSLSGLAALSLLPMAWRSLRRSPRRWVQRR